MTEAEKEKLKHYLIPYLDTITYKKGKQYICPFPDCRSGTGKNGTPAFNIIPNTNETRWKCHSCGRSGDIIELYQELNETDFKTALNELKQQFFGSSYIPTPIQINKARKEELPENFSDFFFKAHQNISASDNYLQNRGISDSLIEKFNIGYIPDWKHPKRPNDEPTSRIIIPTSDYSYLARATHSKDKMKVGKIHIFNLNAIYSENYDYCFVVEGEIDCLSVLQCGYNCIGLGSKNMIDSFLKICKIQPKTILIFSLDTDKGGKEAQEKVSLFLERKIPCIAVNVSGKEKDPNDLLVKAPEQLKANLQKAVEQARKFVFPPADDIIDVIAEEQKSKFNKKNTKHKADDELPYYFFHTDPFDENSPLKVNAALLAKYIRENNKYIFVRNQATDGVNKFWYRNGCYCHISDDELKGLIKEHITKYNEFILKMKYVYEAYGNITTDLNFISSNQINADENIINFQNGLLYLDSMELKPHTPDIYTTIQIPCNYALSSTETPIFDKFMNDFTSGNEEKKKFLLQYMALCISNIKGYRIKKALFMVGDGNTGKSQLKSLTEKLIGIENCSSVTLAELEARFGTANLYNKRLVGDSDMSFMSVKELKMFKQITGGDSIQVEFKNRTPFNYTYNGLMWFCMNELPRFSGDRGQWVYDRIIIFKADNVISEEKRDKHLLDKLYSEREAIISKYLIPELHKLLMNDLNITLPSESAELNKQYQQENNPVIMFYAECCCSETPNNNKSKFTTKQIYGIFKEWCKDNNNGYFVSKIEFNKELMKIFKVSDVKQIQKKINGVRYYNNFTINEETREAYHCYDCI